MKVDKYWSETRWGKFAAGGKKDIPRLINPFMFSSKKLVWPVVPNWGT